MNHFDLVNVCKFIKYFLFWQDNLSRGNLGAVKVLQALFPEPGRLQFIYADLGDAKSVSIWKPRIEFSFVQIYMLIKITKVGCCLNWISRWIKFFQRMHLMLWCILLLLHMLGKAPLIHLSKYWLWDTLGI